jgi:hypothetical protein
MARCLNDAAREPVGYLQLDTLGFGSEGMGGPSEAGELRSVADFSESSVRQLSLSGIGVKSGKSWRYLVDNLKPHSFLCTDLCHIENINGVGELD